LIQGNNGEGFGTYWIGETPFIDEYKTTSISKGELKISFFDSLNRIVAGTFEYDAVNEKGEKVEVREGRFDMKY
jgi:hypothetical protein